MSQRLNPSPGLAALGQPPTSLAAAWLQAVSRPLKGPGLGEASGRLGRRARTLGGKEPLLGQPRFWPGSQGLGPASRSLRHLEATLMAGLAGKSPSAG